MKHTNEIGTKVDLLIKEENTMKEIQFRVQQLKYEIIERLLETNQIHYLSVNWNKLKKDVEQDRF